MFKSFNQLCPITNIGISPMQLFNEREWVKPPYESSNIAKVGYDWDDHTMDVEYTDGALYRYFRVNPNSFTDMQESDSWGNFWHYDREDYRYQKLRSKIPGRRPKRLHRPRYMDWDWS
jgi:hypothetical protein